MESKSKNTGATGLCRSVACEFDERGIFVREDKLKKKVAGFLK
jgi:hypothetical protein